MKLLAVYFSHFPSPPLCYTAVLYTAAWSQIYSLCLTGRTKCEGLHSTECKSVVVCLSVQMLRGWTERETVWGLHSTQCRTVVVCLSVRCWESGQTERQRDRQTGRETDRQKDRQAGRQRDRLTDRQKVLNRTVASFLLIISAFNLCAFRDACKHFGQSDVTLCIDRRFEDTSFETSVARHPRAQGYFQNTGQLLIISRT